MSMFRLASKEGEGSVPNPGAPTRSLVGAVFFGGVTFGAVSVLAYAIWAFRLVPGTVALYATTTVVYFGLGGLALSRLVVAPGSWRKFPLLFAAAFLVYAVCWCAFWFGLKGKYLADLWGAAAGLAVMTWMFQRAFGQRSGFLRFFAVLLVLHSVGYYLGGELYALVRGTGGRLLWGAAHGFGFGAGLGYVLFHCQGRDNRTAA